MIARNKNLSSVIFLEGEVVESPGFFSMTGLSRSLNMSDTWITLHTRQVQV